jgi:undecaprenyl-phosphate galactose phosphotransferase
VVTNHQELAEFFAPGTAAARTGIESDRAETGPSPFRIALDRLAKRAFDISAASVLLILGLPLFGLIALLIATTSSGPVFFRQNRCGFRGRAFVCLKFRTMVRDAERRLREDAALAASHAGQWKIQNDPRITAVGRWLRKTSLDELPQLWNILRGEMSFVGPRPVQLAEMEEVYGPAAKEVTSVKPGLTGLWQVSGRSSLSYDERVALDLAYVDRRSLWLDLKILVKTVPAVLFGRGAV